MKQSVCCHRTAFVGAVFTVLLAAVFSAVAADRPPIKIGFIAPYVGTNAQLGKEMDNGFRLALDEVGYKVSGRSITMIAEDDETKPEMGPIKARKLIEKDKVDLIAGIINSGVALSIRDIVVNHKIPTIYTIAGQVDLTGKLKSPYIFRTSFANGQTDVVGGWYAYQKLGFRRMMVIAPDYTGGHERADYFMNAFKAAGGQITEQLYVPFSTTDFGPYLSKIAAKASGSDGLWVFEFGPGAIRLINQFQEYGLRAKVPLFVLGDTVDEAVLPSMKEAAVGIKSYLHYAVALNTPENQKFVNAYLAKYKEYPSVFSEGGYVGAEAIIMALQAVKGDVENKDAFLAALRKVKFNAPRGPFRFDANQNAIIPVYIRQVQKAADRYVNVVLDTIPDVDQDWSPEKIKR